ncbi:MAG: hypothetical protein AAF539_16250 [Planctomycetota bacterium]
MNATTAVPTTTRSVVVGLVGNSNHELVQRCYACLSKHADAVVPLTKLSDLTQPQRCDLLTHALIAVTDRYRLAWENPGTFNRTSSAFDDPIADYFGPFDVPFDLAIVRAAAAARPLWPDPELRTFDATGIEESIEHWLHATRPMSTHNRTTILLTRNRDHAEAWMRHRRWTHPHETLLWQFHDRPSQLCGPATCIWDTTMVWTETKTGWERRLKPWRNAGINDHVWTPVAVSRGQLKTANAAGVRVSGRLPGPASRYDASSQSDD